MSERLYQMLCEHLTEHKQSLFAQVASNRTRHITVVLENIYQPQNANAVFRSMESWGIQDVYAIENNHRLNIHRRIAKGSYDWLTLHRFNKHEDNTAECVNQLRSRGYRILSTSLTHDAVSADEIDLTQKTAIVMGTELTGISEEMARLSDGFVKIPMVGFTESLNVSVAAGVIMQRLRTRLDQSDIRWQLSPEEQLELKIQWARRSIYWSQHIVDLYEQGEFRDHHS